MVVEHRVEDVEDHRLRQELRFCQHFLVDSELEKARHNIFNYAVETLNGTTVNEKLDHFFNNMKCAAKVNLAFWFHSENYRRRNDSDTFTHTETIPCWIDLNLCAPMTTWQS